MPAFVFCSVSLSHTWHVVCYHKRSTASTDGVIGWYCVTGFS